MVGEPGRGWATQTGGRSEVESGLFEDPTRRRWRGSKHSEEEILATSASRRYSVLDQPKTPRQARPGVSALKLSSQCQPSNSFADFPPNSQPVAISNLPPRPPSPPRTARYTLPPPKPDQDVLAGLFASDLAVPSYRIRLNRNWPGYRTVEKLYLGNLDERKFDRFFVERDSNIEEGLLDLARRDKELQISGYGFNGSLPFKIVFKPNSISRIYAASAGVDEAGEGGADDEEKTDRISLIIETRWTPEFRGHVSSRAPEAGLQTVLPDSEVRLTAFDKPHRDLAPFVSRHFLLVLALPQDRFQPGQPATPESFAALRAAVTNAEHLPDIIYLPSLSFHFGAKHYARKAVLRPLHLALRLVSPAVAYHLEGILRDGTAFPHELIALLQYNIQPWLSTSAYSDALVEDTIIELRTSLVEDRKLRAMKLKLLSETSTAFEEDNVEWDLTRFFEEARGKVVREQEKLELAEETRKERLAAGEAVKGARISGPDSKGEHVWSRSLVFTPSGALKVIGRRLEKSNALIRRYFHPVDGHVESDYFLSVTFLDEDELPLPPLSGEAWNRFIDGSVRRMIKKGFWFGGRLYKFLAYSQSGLRSRSAYFVASWPVLQDGSLRSITADDIRRDLGDFEALSKRPALLGARYSQALSSTYATVHLRPEQIRLTDDILAFDEDGRENGVFTDGAGLMSPALRDEIWDTYIRNGIRKEENNVVPSVVQIRIGGSKGVLALDNRLKDSCIVLRPSMDKFQGFPDVDPHGNPIYTLNVADVFTRPSSFKLNRPLISALDDLGISTDAFLKYQEEAIKSVDPEELFTLDGALFVLEHFQLGTASRLKRLLRSLVELGIDGDIVQQEPFLRYSLEVVRARFFRDLKNKASIPLPDCYQLVGVPDEDRFLAPEEVYICIRRPEAPDSPLYLEGKIVLTRSPVVDPGDVRVVRAVGRLPERSRLRMKALENCVVLSSRGTRPLSSMMGGGDVDGDVYSIITLPDLIPKYIVEPRSHAAAKPFECPGGRVATIEDVADCAINYFGGDNVGIIATAHLIAADYEERHGHSRLCQKLADLHSHAVDAPKTGNLVSREDIPSLSKDAGRPDFLRHSDGDVPLSSGENEYRSERALGYLYRAVDEAELKTPPSVFFEANGVAPTSLDSTSAQLQHLRARVELKLATIFDCSPGRLAILVSTKRETVLPVLSSFAAALSETAVSHSQPRSSGRQLTEVEMYAVTSLLETDRHFAARGNVVSSLGRQVDFYVKWLEGELVGHPTPSEPNYEALQLCYTAWRVAVEEMDEASFGTRMARWVSLSVLLESIKAAEDVKSQAEGPSPPPSQSSHDPASPSNSLYRFDNPPPPPPPPPAPDPLPPAPSPPQTRSNTHHPSTRSLSPSHTFDRNNPMSPPAAARPRTPLESRPTDQYAALSRPPPVPHYWPPHAVAPPVPPPTLQPPSTSQDPFNIAGQKWEQYGVGPEHTWNDPGDDFDDYSDEEAPVGFGGVARGAGEGTRVDETRVDETRVGETSEQGACEGRLEAEQEHLFTPVDYGFPSVPPASNFDRHFDETPSSPSLPRLYDTQQQTLPPSSSHSPLPYVTPDVDDSSQPSPLSAWGSQPSRPPFHPPSETASTAASEYPTTSSLYDPRAEDSPSLALHQESPAPPAKKKYTFRGPTPFWAKFNEQERQRYKSNQSGMGKIGRLVETADGRLLREVTGLGRAPKSAYSGSGDEWGRAGGRGRKGGGGGSNYGGASSVGEEGEDRGGAATTYGARSDAGGAVQSLLGNDGGVGAGGGWAGTGGGGASGRGGAAWKGSEAYQAPMRGRSDWASGGSAATSTVIPGRFQQQDLRFTSAFVPPPSQCSLHDHSRRSASLLDADSAYTSAQPPSQPASSTSTSTSTSTQPLSPPSRAPSLSSSSPPHFLPPPFAERPSFLPTTGGAAAVDEEKVEQPTFRRAGTGRKKGSGMKKSSGW